MSDELALFDLPRPEQPAPRSRSGRGRARETYARTVVADVRVRRPEVLRCEALRVFDDSPTIVVAEVDPDHDAPDPREGIASDWVAALGWLFDPTVDLWPLAEAGAFRLLGVKIDLSDQTADRCRLTWTVTAKLGDVTALRVIAAGACPEGDNGARAEIRESLGAAWQWAAEPYAPLRRVPGIVWTPVEAWVEHRPARTA
jgi:hypothetical protein